MKNIPAEAIGFEAATRGAEETEPLDQGLIEDTLRSEIKALLPPCTHGSGVLEDVLPGVNVEIACFGESCEASVVAHADGKGREMAVFDSHPGLRVTVDSPEYASVTCGGFFEEPVEEGKDRAAGAFRALIGRLEELRQAGWHAKPKTAMIMVLGHRVRTQ
ncbi:MAG: hypothetical protein WD603_01615 [Patescibacteria group bacterium]